MALREKYKDVKAVYNPSSENVLSDDALEHVAGGGWFDSFYEDDRKERFGD